MQINIIFTQLKPIYLPVFTTSKLHISFPVHKSLQYGVGILFIIIFLSSCGQYEKNNTGQMQESPLKINIARAYQVPADSLSTPHSYIAGTPQKIRAGAPLIRPANLNVHPIPAKLNQYNLATLPAPKVNTPGTGNFLLPEEKSPLTKLVPAGIPEVMEVKNAYTKDVNPGNFSSYIKLQGLKHSNVNCILQDQRGNLWLGTDGGGATCYDGKYFTHFTDECGLPSNVVRCMLEDKKGRLWLGTDAGITCYNGTDFTHFNIQHTGLTANIIRCIIEDRNGHIWFASDAAGVIRYDGHKMIYYSVQHGLAGDAAYSIIEDKEGRIWIATTNGISVYDGKSFTNYNHEQQLPIRHVRTVFQDREGNIWIGTEGQGVLKYNHQKFTHYTTADGLGSNVVNAFMQDRTGVIWICFDGGGISRYDGRSFTQFTDKQGLGSNSILCAFEDRSGNTWFGTYGGGISRYDGKLFTHMTESEGMSSSVVRSIIQDRNGAMWFGTNGGGLCRYDGKSFACFTQQQGLSNNVVRCILQEPNGDLWLGTHGGGLCKYDGENFWQYSVDQGMSHNIIRCLFRDSRGNLWLGTYGGGAMKFDGKTFTHYTTREGMSHNIILCITEDDQGRIWFGTEGGGLTCYNGKQFEHYTEKQGLPHNEVWSIARDEKGNFWMATGGGGVVFFDGKRFANFTTREGLSNNAVFSVITDSRKNMWFGTRFGLNKLTFQNRESLVKLVQGDKKQKYDRGQVYFKSYNHEDGFLGIGCFGNAICEDSTGTIWVGTNDRLTAYHPEGEQSDTLAPQVHLNGIDLFNENIAWPGLAHLQQAKDTTLVLGNGVKVSDFNFSGISSWYRLPQQLSLAHHNNFLTFRFIGVTQRQAARVRYQYRLDGLDENWSALVNRTEAPYGNLPHGQYTFRVRAMNSEGYWSKEFKYSFNIRPPWWKTLWFRILLVVLALLVLYLVYYWRTATLRNSQRRLEQTVISRTAELVLQKEEAEKQKNFAEKQKELVEKKQREITDSITYAKHIQEAILPPESLVKRWLPQSFILYKPKDIVAGDFYFFEVTETHLFYAVADCTGHGVPGALVSVVCSNALTRCVKEFNLTRPGQILDKARQLVIETFEKSGQDVKDGMDISLISFNFESLHFNIKTSGNDIEDNFGIRNSSFEISWAGANNPLWIVNRDGTITEVAPDKQPIGKTDRPRPFSTHQLNLEPGSFIFLFTDGYADQFGGQKGKKMKYKRMKELLQHTVMLPQNEQVNYLEEQFDEWRGSREQVDDVCVIGIRI